MYLLEYTKNKILQVYYKPHQSMPSLRFACKSLRDFKLD